MITYEIDIRLGLADLDEPLLQQSGTMVWRGVAGERMPYAFFPANGETEIVAGRKMHHTRRAELLVSVLQALVQAQDLT